MSKITIMSLDFWKLKGPNFRVLIIVNSEGKSTLEIQ